MKKIKRRYTFVLDCKGGTYIAQVSATSLEQAFKRWYREIEMAKIPDADEIINTFGKVGSVAATPIEGLDQVWCAVALIRHSIATIKIVGSH